ncbi:MAG: flagellar basal body rod C-terminal domain-containing protein, partial [Deltaproteobacteria bacterium]|nr:flagellar basal body rod C-terminal domain-containing protein [Deltaproteobacteria bacterium]
VTSPLDISLNPDSSIYDIVSNGIVLNGRITGGSLKGIIDASSYYEDARADLDILSVSIAKEINLQHRAGYGLDGTTGLDFFSLPPVYTNASSNNTGGAAVAGGFVSDLSLLTLDDYEVRFSGPSAYTIVNSETNTVVSGGAYVSGSPITIDGLAFTITDNTGSPQAGDKFVISPTKGAAASFSVALSDPNSFAASSTASGVPGDNSNAFTLAGLKDSQTINGATFSEYYSSIVTDIGVASGEASTNLKSQQVFLDELNVARESVSGVSVEEESINLIKLQRAYEAAAKVMETANKMLDALLTIV